MPKIIAIIPARGGSKRIPGKNIRNFCGMPIIGYSIKAAQESGCFDEIMVSTDDARIADIARNLGASVPFMRSEKNSTDFTGLADVIEEVLSEYKKSGKKFDIFACILPTAPFVTAGRLKQALAQLLKSKADGVFAIVRFSYPILRALKLEQGEVKMMWPENYNKRSQDFAPAFHDAGQFYFMYSDRFMANKKLFTEHTQGMEVSESEVQDIDSEEDWKAAEIKFQFLQRKNRGDR